MRNAFARAAVLAAAFALLLVPSATAKVFPDCKAVDSVYKHGIARNFKVIKKANGLTGRPFVSSKLYAANIKKDRDHDGVACEK